MKTTASTQVLSLHQLSLYNTNRMSAEQVIAAFAARRQQFERIIADLAAEQPRSRAQHHLIVGQRGMGKTMLLARIAAEIRTTPALTARFIPLIFAEEQYAVDRLSKFWLNCLDSLADARELAQDTAAVTAIDATVARLQAAGIKAAKDDQPFADEVYAAFIDAAKASKQRPVLLVDNLQLVFERLETGQQHSLRELLMRPGSPILIGASPSPPPQSQDYGAAFYDHFKVHYLRPLDLEEMRALLLHLAGAAQRDDVRQRVLQHPARLAVLRQLTGGNPRTVLTLFFLYAEDFAPSVFGDLEGLLDRVTPLYKARFEELTPQQQVVASAIANNWDPITAAGIAKVTGLPAGTISAQLDRLEKTGNVERTELFGEARYGYQIAERFFNIWFLMRSASRRQRREVEFLTRFLENFYEPADRSRIASHLQGECNFSADRQIWARALACTLDASEAHDLTRHAELDALRQKEAYARRMLEEVVDFTSLRPCVLRFAELHERLAALVPADAGVKPEEFAEKILSDRKMFLSGNREKLAVRAQLSEEEVRKALDSVEASGAMDRAEYGTEAVNWVSRRLYTGQLVDLRDVEDWEAAFRQAVEVPVSRLLIDMVPDEIVRKLSKEVIAIINQRIQPPEESSTDDFIQWAADLVKLNELDRALAACRKRIVLDDKNVGLWICVGLILYALRCYDEALVASQKAIAVDETSAMAWFTLGWLLAEHLGQYLDAENAFRKAIDLDESLPGCWAALGLLLRDHTSRYAEAEKVLLRAISLDGADARGWIRLGNLYCDFMDRPIDAAAAFERASELESGNLEAAHALLFLHRDFLGEGMAAESRFRRIQDSPISSGEPLMDLHSALFAAYEKNWGLACDGLEKVLAHTDGEIPTNMRMDWIRVSAVLLHLNYGAELLAFLDQRGDTARLRPWVEALRAHQIGDRLALMNIAPEVRTAAEVFYDGIESRLKKLPEKTRRRPLPKPK